MAEASQRVVSESTAPAIPRGSRALASLIVAAFIGVRLLALPYDQVVGAFNGVTVYSNGTSGYFSGIPHYVNGTYVGIKWQCVEFVRRYYLQVFGLVLPPIAPGDADTWYQNATAMGLVAFPNGGSTPPAVGDVLVSNGGVNGHIGIVRSVSTGEVCTVSQNLTNDEAELNRCHSMTVNGASHTVAGYTAGLPIHGWLRRPGQSQPTDRYLTKLASDPTQYWVQSGRRFGVVSLEVLDVMRSSGLPGWTSPYVVVPVLPGVPGPTFIAPNSGSNGLLIRQTGATTVFLMQNGRRRPFTSPAALSWRHQEFWGDVIEVPGATLSAYTSGEGQPLYGVGEGEADTTAQQQYAEAYSRLMASCGTTTWAGWPRSFATCLEFPQSAVLGAATSGASGIAGDYQNFGNENIRLGALVQSPRGTWGVWGAIYSFWQSMGYSASWLGFPTSDEYQWGAYRRTDFEAGYVFWNPATNETQAVRSDASAPSISISSPTGLPSYSTSSTPISLGGYASDNLAVTSVTWANAATGQTGTAGGTAPWAAVVPLASGSNVITVIARDAAGLQGTDSITVTYTPPDAVAPTIQITTPTTSSSYTTTATPLTVAGTAADNVQVTTVTWANAANGRTGTAAGATAWSAAVPLAAGTNVIAVTARDGAGNTAADTLTVTYQPPDTIAPTIQISTPTTLPNFDTQRTPLLVAGIAFDAVGVVAVSWANLTSGQGGNATGLANWSASIPLTRGANALVVTVRDAAGNSGTDTITVSYTPGTPTDTSPPSVSITTPTSAPTHLSTSSPIIVGGTALDDVGVVGVSWTNVQTGASGPAVGSGQGWSALVSLQNGANEFVVSAVDAAGNSATDRLTITFSASQSGDADDDQLPDAWEQQMGLDATSGAGADGPSGDPDDDTVANLQEHEAGTHPLLPNLQSLPEGSTGFHWQRLALANPADTPASVTVRFLLPNGLTREHAYIVGAKERATVNVNTLPGLENTDLSTVVIANAGGVAVERTMMWPKDGVYGGHTGKALRQPRTRWYLAEGEASFFDTFIQFANATTAAAHVSVQFLREDGQTVTRTYTLQGNARMTVWANDIQGVRGTSFSAVIDSSQPITVERAMYFSANGQLWAGGSVSAAIAEPATTWLVAEGSTGEFWDEYLLLANPGNGNVHVTIRFLRDDGVVIARELDLRPTSRTTLQVDAVPGLQSASNSAEVIADAPIIVERAMYWPRWPWREAHASAGLTATGTRWLLAEGELGGHLQYSTYVQIANPTASEATVTLTVLREGRPFRTFVHRVGANSRATADASTWGLADGERFGVLVDSSQPIAVERAMYWNGGGEFWGAGTNETALRLR